VKLAAKESEWLRVVKPLERVQVRDEPSAIVGDTLLLG
jgi:hypothetical protein